MELNTLEIGNRIRMRREELNITKNEMSEILDVTPKFCSDIELGARGMSLKTLMKISKTLYVSTDYILFGEEESEGEKTPFALFALTVPKEKSPYYLRICKEIENLSNLEN